MSATATGPLERTARAIQICARANLQLARERQEAQARELARRAGTPQHRASGRGGHKPSFRDSYGQDGSR